MEIIIGIIIVLSLWLLIKSLKSKRKEGDYSKSAGNYNRDEKNYNRGTNTNKTNKTKERETKSSKPGIFSRILNFDPYFPYDNETISWCVNFLHVNEKDLRKILKNISGHYTRFQMKKRKGGFRTISVPHLRLLLIQKIIYNRILKPAHIHSSATGFREKKSIVDNAYPHLGKREVFKTDP